MSNAEKTRDIWYDLDNAAKIFPSVSDEDNTNVFRLACELKEPIEPDALQQALDTAMESFPYFQVVMRRGLFWFYLERSNLRPAAKPEGERPCSRLFYKQVKELLFRVTYFQNRINLEVFHAVADGVGAFDLLRAIVYQYILLVHRGELPAQPPTLDSEPPPTRQVEDSFRHYYNPSEKSSPFKVRAYNLAGTLLPSGSIRVISATAPTPALLALAKSRRTTVTAYLAALMICAVYHEMMPKRASGRTISVTIPVDLRGHFTSETARNFFSVVDVGYNFADQGGDFDEVLASVTAQLGEKVSAGALTGRLNYNMSVQSNIFTRFTPLILKNIILRIAYHKAESATTCALSNMGRLTIPAPFSDYIDRFSCLLNPTRIHRWKLCVCSFEDKFILNFTSCIAETSLHKYVVRHLSAAGIPLCITCNGVNEDEIL